MSDITNPSPVVTTRDGNLYANSKNVADCFNKRHDNVLRDIEALVKSTASDLRWFTPVTYIDAKGEERKSFEMTRDGFTLLVMGWTGEKALQFKVLYIHEFNAMEQAPRQAQVQLPDFNDPVAAARAWADAQEKKRIAESLAFLAEDRAVNSTRRLPATLTQGARPLFAFLGAPIMGDITNFTFNGNDIRVVMIEDQPWFVAADILNALGYPATSHSQIASKLSADEVIVKQIHKGVRSVRLVRESGLYALINRSDKPQAKPFQDWVTRDVLPAIRKDGAYIQGEEKVASGELSEDEFVLRAISILQAKVDRLKQERDAAVEKQDDMRAAA